MRECGGEVSGLNMEVNGFDWHKNLKPPTSEELCEATRPYFEYTIEQFGPERCLFESNFPVDKVELQLHGLLEFVQVADSQLLIQRKGADVPRRRQTGVQAVAHSLMVLGI